MKLTIQHQERHVISRLVKELGIEILTSGDQYVIGEVTGLLTSTGCDRKQEEEADLFAAHLLEASAIELDWEEIRSGL